MNLTYKAVLIDDEANSRSNLSSLIEVYCPEIDVMGVYENGDDALNYLLRNKVDLIFLDIHMPKMSGFELLMNMGNHASKIIMVSAHENYGIEAIKANAFDYILKPVGISDLRTLIDRLGKGEGDTSSNVSEEEYKISVPLSHGLKIIDWRTIVRIESENSYTQMIMIDGAKQLITRNIKDFERILDDVGFYRIHNKHLINLQHLEEYSKTDGGIAIMVNGDEVPISRRKLKEFREVLKSKYDKLS